LVVVSVVVACSGRCALGELGLEVRSITNVVMGGITDVSCWIVIDTIDSALRIGELEQVMENLIQDNKYLKKRLDSYGACLYTLKNLDIPQQNSFRDFPEVDMKEILHQRMWETNSYKTHEDHMMLYEALEKSMNRDHTDELLKDLDEAHIKKKKRRDSLKMPPGSPPHQPPPPPLPPAGPSGTSC
nr:hypothetical protein [Tanacetum cinerariifolium]